MIAESENAPALNPMHDRSSTIHSPQGLTSVRFVTSNPLIMISAAAISPTPITTHKNADPQPENIIRRFSS